MIASDETSARVEGQTCWQWVFGSATAVAHRIAASRGKAVVSESLKDATPEVWVSDRLGAQMNHATAHQVDPLQQRPRLAPASHFGCQRLPGT